MTLFVINIPLTPLNTSLWMLCTLGEAPIEATVEVALIPKETMGEAGRTLLKTVPVDAQMVTANSREED